MSRRIAISSAVALLVVIVAVVSAVGIARVQAPSAAPLPTAVKGFQSLEVGQTYDFLMIGRCKIVSDHGDGWVVVSYLEDGKGEMGLLNLRQVLLVTACPQFFVRGDQAADQLERIALPHGSTAPPGC